MNKTEYLIMKTIKEVHFELTKIRVIQSMKSEIKRGFKNAAKY